jgi:SAM-dependent methyltransferase
MRRFLYSVKLALRQYIMLRPLRMLNDAGWYWRDYAKLKKQGNEKFALDASHLLPCLTDKTADNPLDYIYFYQNAWAASKIFDYKPTEHFDIGSQVGFVGIISQFVKTTFIDIRGIDVNLKGLSFQPCDILKLPYPDNSLESVSSICVVEHIGLGRYGDTVNAYGSEEAIREIIRVVKPGGKIIISVPVDNMNRIYFNAHRAFEPSYIYTLFSLCSMLEERYIYGSRLEEKYSPSKGFGTGLYFFEKK